MFITILKQLIINIFVPVAVKTVKEYINTTDTKKDDKLLEIAQLSTQYLAEQTNNTVTKKIAEELNVCTTVKCQNSKN